MIADWNTNFIYFSRILTEKPEYKESFKNISKVLNELGCEYGFLNKTNDIWARDYMPIQIDVDKFVEYRYDPDYLQSVTDRKIKTYPDLVCHDHKYVTSKSNLILDGGNVVKSNNHIILTDKVVNENIHQYDKNELISQLRKTFEVDHVILIPWDKANDMYGHADAMVRFIDNQTVLVGEWYRYKKMENKLKEYNLKIEYLEYDVSNKSSTDWSTLNFLLTSQVLIFPIVKNDEWNNKIMQQLRGYFSTYAERDAIRTVEISDIVNLDGALNCISWTIKK